MSNHPIQFSHMLKWDSTINKVKTCIGEASPEDNPSNVKQNTEN